MDHLTSSTAERWKELWQPDTKFGPDSSWIQKSFCCCIMPLCRLCICNSEEFYVCDQSDPLSVVLTTKFTSIINMDYSRAFWSYQLHQKWVKIQGFRDMLSFHHEGQCDK